MQIFDKKKSRFVKLSESPSKDRWFLMFITISGKDHSLSDAERGEYLVQHFLAVHTANHFL